MSNALALVGGDLSTLKRLSLGEIENAFFGCIPICGFYIRQMGINASVFKDVGLHDIALVHINSGVEIYLNRNGQMEIK